MDSLFALVDHLGHMPMTWLLATLGVYRLALIVQRWAGFSALAHPVAVSTAMLIAILGATGVDYQTYFDGARPIHLLLGPATVALAVPFHQQIQFIRRRWLGLLCGALFGSLASVVLAIGLATALGASESTVLSLAAKSVTMPIALGLAERIGGLPSLTSALVMLTGVVGAMATQAVLARLRIRDPDVCGFSLGVVAHGIGTARALQAGSRMGGFAGLGMGLAGLLTAFFLPLIVKLMGYS